MTHIKSKDYVLLAGKEPNIILNENPFEIYNKDVLSFLETFIKVGNRGASLLFGEYTTGVIIYRSNLF